MKLNKAHKKAIKEWLEGDPCDCPFNYIPLDGWQDVCYDLCPTLFPRLVKLGRARVSGENWCPCNNYTVNYVRRVARRVVEVDND